MHSKTLRDLTNAACRRQVMECGSIRPLELGLDSALVDQGIGFVATNRSRSPQENAVWIVGAGEGAEREKFDRDQPIKIALARLLDDAHAAAADFLDQSVIAEGSGARERDW